MKRECKQYLISYAYSDGNKTGYGSVVITQSKYRPITPDLLANECEAERQRICSCEDAVLVPIGFFRFEAEDETE